MKVIVCSACGQESCWQGIFYCEEYKTAGTIEIEKSGEVGDE